MTVPGSTARLPRLVTPHTTPARSTATYEATPSSSSGSGRGVARMRQRQRQSQRQLWRLGSWLAARLPALGSAQSGSKHSMPRKKTAACWRPNQQGLHPSPQRPWAAIAAITCRCGQTSRGCTHHQGQDTPTTVAAAPWVALVIPPPAALPWHRAPPPRSGPPHRLVPPAGGRGGQGVSPGRGGGLRKRLAQLRRAQAITGIHPPRAASPRPWPHQPERR